MAIYNVFYLPPDGRLGDEEPLGKFDTQEEADDVVSEEVARRTGADLQLVEKVFAAWRRYRVVLSDESEEDIKARVNRAMADGALKARLVP